MFNWGKTPHDESAEAVGGALSQEESDVALRLRLFKQCPTYSYAHPRAGFGVFFPSPFAVRTLWNYQMELKYVAEAERRRKQDLPTETFKEFLEKERTGDEYTQCYWALSFLPLRDSSCLTLTTAAATCTTKF